MDNIKFNKCQSSIEELELHKYPNEVVEQFYDFINNVPFIKWMISPERPMISELPRDDSKGMGRLLESKYWYVGYRRLLLDAQLLSNAPYC